jgi:hypothetical protein
MNGVEWIQFGHYGLVRDLDTARAAAQQLQELGFDFHRSAKVGRTGVFYDFVFIGDYTTPTHHFEVVTITVIAVDHSDRPPFEIVYSLPGDGDKPDGPLRRYGSRVYTSEIHVDGYQLTSACRKYGHDRVQTRPTLWP